MNDEASSREKGPAGDGLDQNEEYEQVLSSYYSGAESVRALMALKVDTKMADEIAIKVAEIPAVEDVYMVTGDVDIIMRCDFDTYNALRNFIVSDLGAIKGIKDTRTMMIVTTFKENGKVTEN